jgi:hypothetical protein
LQIRVRESGRIETKMIAQLRLKKAAVTIAKFKEGAIDSALGVIKAL